jgi:uncharacterized membrane protein
MKTLRLVCGCCLLLVCLLAIGLPGIALTQEGEEVVTDNNTLPQEEPVADNITLPQEEEEAEPTTIPEGIAITPAYPTVESIAGGDFEFLLELVYIGMESRAFDLRVTAPKGWEVYMTPQYEKDRKISSISMKSGYGTTEKIRVVATAPFWPLPEPGDYKITIEAVSETISGSTEITAKITAVYILKTEPTAQLYNTKAKAGRDNIFSITVNNLGSDAIDDIKFTSDTPQGWSVEFEPDKIEVLEAIIGEQTVNVNIKPPSKTIAGDYMISLRASGKQTSADEMSIRVTVETPTLWGWVGVAIILIVVIGLIFIFMRFSRR